MDSLWENVVAGVAPADPVWRGKAAERISRLTMPHWALGRLLDVAVDLAGMARTLAPPLSRRAVALMAGDHGVAAKGVSAFPQEVTVQMVRNFVRGGAAINALARHAGAEVVVVDVGVAGDLSDLWDSGAVVNRRVADGTADITEGPAMTRAQAVQCLEAGMETGLRLAANADVLATGDMGIANTTPSSAIVAVLCGEEPDRVTCRGTGIDEASRQRKARAVARALEVNRPDPLDPVDVLAKVGGFEIGAIAGFILAAASARKPVLVDGFISTAGALVAQALCPPAVDYMIAAHKSAERGHATALHALGKLPLLDWGMRLGEGSGAALCFNLLEAAVRVVSEMATFDEAGVSGSNS